MVIKKPTTANTSTARSVKEVDSIGRLTKVVRVLKALFIPTAIGSVVQIVQVGEIAEVRNGNVGHANTVSARTTRTSRTSPRGRGGSIVEDRIDIEYTLLDFIHCMSLGLRMLWLLLFLRSLLLWQRWRRGLGLREVRLLLLVLWFIVVNGTR
jgi:hypothetical protein